MGPNIEKKKFAMSRTKIKQDRETIMKQREGPGQNEDGEQSQEISGSKQPCFWKLYQNNRGGSSVELKKNPEPHFILNVLER